MENQRPWALLLPVVLKAHGNGLGASILYRQAFISSQTPYYLPPQSMPYLSISGKLNNPHAKDLGTEPTTHSLCGKHSNNQVIKPLFATQVEY